MAYDPSIKATSGSAAQAAQQTAQQTIAKKGLAGGQMGKEEFLTLLVNQLQHQDPLNPMDNQEFAVQLAQFSQLEQMIDINKKLTGSGSTGTEMASLASFLGQNVVLKDQAATFTNGQGPDVRLELPKGAVSARIDLVDADGKVQGSIPVDPKLNGSTFKLTGADVPNGSYTLKPVAVESTGRFVDGKASVVGTVEGFVMQPEPALLVNGSEVKLDQVLEVYTNKQATA